MPWSSSTARHWLAGFGVVSWPRPMTVLAHRYELVDARLSAAGFAREVSSGVDQAAV